MHRLLTRQIRKAFGDATAQSLPPEIQRLLELVNDSYVQTDADRTLLERSMELSSNELLARNQSLLSTNQALRDAEQKYRAIFENATEGIFQTTADGRYIAANPALAEIIGYASPADLLASVNSIQTQIYVDETRRAQFADIIARNCEILQFESQVRRKDGNIIWISETARGVNGPDGKLLYYEGTVIDITLRKRSEKEREELQSRLVAASRQSGMAEVATGVLHNVGNVLNSVNVSASLAGEKLRSSKLSQLAKAVDLLLQQPAASLPQFLTEDTKGKVLPTYLGKVTQIMTAEHAEVLAELGTLAKNIDHIKEVVSMQQTYAKVAGVTEKVLLNELIEDAIRLDSDSFERHGVTIVREYEPMPTVTIDKHRVLQILVNLLSNAKHAVNEQRRRLSASGAPTTQKLLTIRIARVSNIPNRVRLQIVDTGTGIAQEDLTRIFSLGFTTKKDGHGFGLHSSALAAKALGGSLMATSAGPGTGATFSLELEVNTSDFAEIKS
jgi:PAS domain S-box-containing protein